MGDGEREPRSRCASASGGETWRDGNGKHRDGEKQCGEIAESRGEEEEKTRGSCEEGRCERGEGVGGVPELEHPPG